MRDEPEPVILRATGKTRLTCALCQAQFEVPFRHRFELDGARPKLERYGALDRVTDDELSFHRNRACPACGAAPAKAIGAKRELWDICIALAGLGFPASIVVIALVLPLGGNHANLVLLAVMAIAILQFLGHCAVGYLCGIPANANAKAETAALKLTVLEPDPERPVRKFHWPNRMLGAAFLAVAVAAPVPPLVFLNSKWDVVNAEEDPALVGPGSRTTVSLAPTFTSPNGVWWGTVDAKVVNAEALGLNRREIAATVPKNTGRKLTIADDGATFTRKSGSTSRTIPR